MTNNRLSCMERNFTIDILRGIAVIQMIFWQIFDFFSETNIYAYNSPYFFIPFNTPINGIGLALFAFVSGASLYLSFRKKLNRNNKKTTILLQGIKRYGGYILLSLLFTSFVFGFKRFYVWGEAIQGIGFSALITLILLLVFENKINYLILALFVSLSQPFLRDALQNSIINQIFPLEPNSFNILANSIAILLNATIRGFFSLTHTLPFMLFGIFSAILLIKFSQRILIRVALPIASLLIITSLLMHFLFNKIDVYRWSSSYLIGFSGLCFLLFAFSEHTISKSKQYMGINFLTTFGKYAIISYLLHFILIYMPLKILNLESKFGYFASYLFTLFAIIIIYYLCRGYGKFISKEKSEFRST